MNLPQVAALLNVNESYGRGIFRGIKRWVWQFPTFQIITPGPGLSLHDEKLDAWTGAGVIAQFGSHDAVHKLIARGIHLVNVSNRVPMPSIHSVFSDDLAVGSLAAQHFLDLGFRHFAFVGFENYIFSLQRLEGFQKLLHAHGYLVRQCPPLPFGRHYADVQAVLDPFLASCRKPLAVFAASDARAKQVTLAAQNLNLKIPEEVAVVGVDNDDLQSNLAAAPLSSVELALEDIGYHAASLMADLLSKNHISPQPKRIPPIRVIPRESSNLIAATDPDIARALELIRTNAHRPLKPSEIHAVAAGSPRAFKSRFEAVVQRSVNDEIRRARVELAKSLLRETDRPIHEIAAQSGFQATSRLSLSFRRETGMTPNRYRRIHRKA